MSAALVGAGDTCASGRGTADLLIDRDRLSALVGRPVRAVRLRHKPGLSTSAVLLDTADSRPPGWIQVSYPGHIDKLRNALRRAGKRGQLVHVREVPSDVAPGGLLLAHGEIDSDPRLQRGLDAVHEMHPSVHAALASGELSLLRYNPQRRLVLHRPVTGSESQVLRVTAGEQNDARRRLAALAAAGVPLLQPVATRGMPQSRRVAVWPWFGTGDLQQAPPESRQRFAVTAGRALATLHAVPAGGLGFEQVPDPSGELTVLADDLCHLDAGAGRRMGPLVAEVTRLISAGSWGVGTIHGDFSADQVLVDGRPGGEGTGVVLTDFDRVGTGPLALDLGMFAAVELITRTPVPTGEAPSATGATALEALPLTSALVEGYAEARHSGPCGPDPAWVARALLTLAHEPFRAGEPDWIARVHHRLDQVRKVLS